METRIQTIASFRTHSFSAQLDEVRLQNGVVGKRIRIDHPEAAAIIPFLSGDRIVMVRQFRYALGRETLEIPAGKVDAGEGIETCAQRELMEETGYHAETITHLYTYAPAIGYSNELIHIYAGRDLKKTHREIDSSEIHGLEILPLSRIREMIRKGLILDGKTLIGLFVADVLGAP